MDEIFNLFENQTIYERELRKAFKRIFSGSIKESFLIDVYNFIVKDPRYHFILFGTTDFKKELSIDSLATGNGFNTIDICKMIVMCHYANTVSLTEQERGKQQQSKKYIDKLINDVLNMLKIKQLATNTFSKSSLESYLPIIYYSSALNNFLANQYDMLKANKVKVNQNYNEDFNYLMIYKLIIKIRACINLADIKAVDELMVLYRTLIELFMTYVALWDQNDAIIDSFKMFDQAAFDYNYDGRIPDNIKIMANDQKANEIQFLNYGWIKNLPEFKSLTNKSKCFNLGGLGKILDIKYGNYITNFGSELYKFYRACNPQTHGTTLFLNYFQTELYIFQNMAVMIKFISRIFSENLFNLNLKFQDVDLLNEISNALNDSRKVYDWLCSDQKHLDRTNIEYTKRAVCSMRMRN